MILAKYGAMGLVCKKAVSRLSGSGLLFEADRHSDQQ